MMLERIAKVPGLRQRAVELSMKALPDISDREGRDAAIASAAEFILEGLHVHNKLNKTAKAGGATYRR
jgi:magnesium chelatase subunit I